MPITVMTGYLRFSLLNKLIAQLRIAYEGSAHIACEQVAAIRTVVALNREVSLQKEYVANLKGPVRKALYSTFRSTFVHSPDIWSLLVVVCFGTEFSFFYECFGVLVWESSPRLS